MIRVRAGVDDVAGGQFGQFSDRSQNPVGGALAARIHQYHAIDADLDADVSAGAGDHVKVRTNLHHVKTAAGLLRTCGRDCATDNENQSGRHASRIK